MARTNIGFPLAVGGGGGVYQSSGPGITEAALNTFRVTPLTSNATNISVMQTVSATTFALTVGTGTVTGTGPGGVFAVQFDTPRTIAMSGTASGNATRVTITGYDLVRQPMTEVISSPAGATKTFGVKAFLGVISAAAASNTASNIAIGSSDVLGLNVRIDSASQVTAINWNNTLATATTGLTVASTVTATASTGDVRGTYAVQTAADGTKALTFAYVVNDPDTTAGIYGVTQA